MISIIDYSVFNYKFCYSLERPYLKNNISYNISPLIGWRQSIRNHRNNTIYIALDGLPKESVSIYPSYKGTRNNYLSAQLRIPLNLILRYITFLAKKYNKDLHIVCAPNQEADQVISSLVHIISGNIPDNKALIDSMNSYSLSEDPILSKKNLECSESTIEFISQDNVVILTTDSDMYQLLRFDSVFIDNQSTVASFIEKPITPKAVGQLNYYAIIAYKALLGDVSDNVPASTSASPSKLIPILSKVDSQQKLDMLLKGLRIGKYKLPNFNRQIFDNNLSVTRLRYYGNLKELVFEPLSDKEVIGLL